ncbi:MAG TPA: LuxR C-terminal-related transcriptional regulator [Bacillus sp. (in: firmicutes)]|nr:LuxR C-terminal-related transcriptional regulator [Bacillus sp. (in: firmicutes)]
MLEEKIRKLEDISNQDEQLYKSMELYMETFPVKNCYLFRYSPLGYLAEGIVLLTSSELVHIREIRDDIRSLPIIHASIRERKAKYCSGIEYLKQASSKYTFASTISSMVIVPIRFSSVVIGYYLSNEFLEGSKVEEKMLSSFTRFGKLVGKVLEKNTSEARSQLLSKRELEVMKRIESTKEMADTMDISEFTVKQYVKSAINKLGAQNRPHAVSELLRKGIIS